MMYEELIAQMRFCAEDQPVEECQEKCPNFGNFRPYEYCFSKLLAEAADALEELLKAASAMHEWIFLNSGDEQAAYDECGLSEEMNAALGYGGQFVVEPPKEDKK